MKKWQKVIGSILLVYFLVWFTDSIFGYIPHFDSTPTISTDNEDKKFNCNSYYDSMGEFVEPCLDEYPVEDPGWQGR